jgi:Glu-tRNA(Gln) amidotransferase subunit E-like FAD-binding protein
LKHISRLDTKEKLFCGCPTLLRDTKESKLESEGNKKEPNIGKMRNLLENVKKILPHAYELLKPFIQEYIKKSLRLES